MGNLVGVKEVKAATMFAPENHEDQRRIIDEVESHMSVCDIVNQTVNIALAWAGALRQSILKEAFEGRLV